VTIPAVRRRTPWRNHRSAAAAQSDRRTATGGSWRHRSAARTALDPGVRQALRDPRRV